MLEHGRETVNLIDEINQFIVDNGEFDRFVQRIKDDKERGFKWTSEYVRIRLCRLERLDVRPRSHLVTCLKERRRVVWAHAEKLERFRRASELKEEAKRRQAEQERQEEERRKAELARQRAIEAERRRHEERKQKVHAALIERTRVVLFKRLSQGFLTISDDELNHFGEVLSRSEIQGLIGEYIKSWFAGRNLPIPDADQVQAVGATKKNVLVTARAGSGKTGTMINRAIFLVEAGEVDAHEILLLAFNKGAAAEMQRRLEDLGCTCPHVMTFHALAHAIVHPEEELIYDSSDSHVRQHSKSLQRVIDELLDRPDRQDSIRQLMMEYFRSDWEHIEEVGLGAGMEHGLKFRRSLAQESLNGESIKSGGEKVIANFLFEHGIPYRYEQNHWWEGRNYKPDFTLQGSGLIIEYFGMAGDPDYDEQSEDKRNYWKEKEEYTLLEVDPSHFKNGGRAGFEQVLKEKLREHGVRCDRLSEQEIWDRIRERVLTDFATIAKNFIGRCRSMELDVAGLRSLIRSQHALGEDEARFLEEIVHIFQAYLQRLHYESEEDFNGLLSRACSEVESGNGHFDRKSGAGDLSKIKHILVDEFQDFSPLFYRLMNSIRGLNPDVNLFCVGDDWQAINSFAGSDLKFFRNYGTYFCPATPLAITTNYRSDTRIVEAGNAIMKGHGLQARAKAAAGPGDVFLGLLDDFRPSLSEGERYGGDSITPALRRLIRDSVEREESIAILARTNTVPYYTSGIKKAKTGSWNLSTFAKLLIDGLDSKQRDLVKVSTAHKFKGLEADTAVVIDAVDTKYPLLHPHSVFTRVLGDTIGVLVDNELRLFYVACTRAARRLIVLTESQRESPFLECIKPLAETLRWEDFVPFIDKDGRLEIKIYNQLGYGTNATYERREILKAHGFRWSGSEGKYWGKVLPKGTNESDVARTLKEEAWAKQASSLEVHACTPDGTVIAIYQCGETEWTKLPATAVTEILQSRNSQEPSSRNRRPDHSSSRNISGAWESGGGGYDLPPDDDIPF